MPLALSPLEAQVEELARSMKELASRVDSIEQKLGTAALREETRAELPAEPLVARSEAEEEDEEGLFDLALVGRTLMILGGAYLLRAVTQNEMLPRIVGMVVGLAYAAGWLFAAYRVAPVRRKPAIFEGGIATAIALSMVWESSARFRYIGVEIATLITVAIVVAVLTIAVKRMLPLLAWGAVVGAVLSLVAIALGTKSMLAPATGLFLVSFAAWWVAAIPQFRYLEWLPGFETDILFLAIPFLLHKTGESRTAAAVLLTSAFLIVAIGLVLKAFLRHSRETFFEIAHASLLFPIALGGATWLLRESAGAGAALASISLIAAASMFAIAFQDREEERDLRTFLFFSVAATALVIYSATMLAPAPIATVAFAFLAVTIIVLARKQPETLFPLHAVLLAIAASIGSGLLLFSLAALFAPFDGKPVAADPEAFIVLAALIGATVAVKVQGDDVTKAISRTSRVLLLVLAALGVAAVAIAALQRVTDSPAMVATFRTVVLSVAALLFAGAARQKILPEGRVLVNPLLVVCALKLLLEDFRVGTAATLFLSLGVYGGALVIAARLRPARHHAHHPA